MKRFERVQQILEEAVGGTTIGAHGNFWRGITIDQFKIKRVFGRNLLIVGNPDDSNLICALEGRAPFGADLGVPGAVFARMPDGFPPVSPDRIAFLRQWIADGCPDDDVPLFDLSRHNDYWRDFDDWAMFHATVEVQDAIGEFFNVVPIWMELARDPGRLKDWLDAIAASTVDAAIVLLRQRILDTIHTHYGNPAVAEHLWESYELFGSDQLPDDPLRPADVRHNMNGSVMWFFYAALIDTQLRTSSAAVEWVDIGKAVLLGLLNDGLLRGRFTVTGFSADAAGARQAKLHVQALAASGLSAELQQRFVDSGLVVA